MKKISFIVLVISVLLVSGFRISQDNTKALAKVNQNQGFYLFVESEPITEYEYLGTVTNTIGLTGSQFDAVKSSLIRKASKKYPEGNGIIFHMANEGTDKADIIKLKD